MGTCTLIEAAKIVDAAAKAYFRGHEAPVSGGTEAELRFAMGERADAAREAMWDALFKLRPHHVAAIAAALRAKGDGHGE